MTDWHSESRVKNLPEPVDAFKKATPKAEPSSEEPTPQTAPEEHPASSDSEPTPPAEDGAAPGE